MPLRFRSNDRYVVAPPTAGCRDESREAEITVHSYLNDVDRRLSHLPPDMRIEVRRELHSHLETLIAAKVERGDDRETAVSAALRKFRDARTIARRFHDVWRQSGGDAVQEATYEALMIFGVMLVATVLLDGLQHIILDPFLRVHLGSNVSNIIRETWMDIFLFLAPALVGLRHSRRFPRFASAGLLCGIGMLVLAVAPFVTTFGPSGAVGEDLIRHHPWIWHFEAARVLVEGLLGAWLFTGIAAAALSGLVSRRLATPAKRARLALKG